MSVFAAVLIPALLLVLTLVTDGTDRMRALARADAVAAEAARTALTAIDTRGSRITLDTRAATAAAHAYLAATGHTGTAEIAGTTVHVTASHTEPAAIGLLEPEHHVTGHATATLATSGGAP